MQLIICGVRDRTAQFFFPPFFVRTQVEAIRVFERLMSDPNRSGATSEYELLSLGTFDDQTGIIDSPLHTVLANGSDFKPAAPQPTNRGEPQ